MRARIMTARLLPVSILLPALFLLHGCGAGHSQTPSASAATAAVPVAVAAVRLAPIAASYVGTAALEADHETDIVAKTGGVLLRIDIEEGDTVRAGQVLAELDGAQARLAVDEADATLKKLRSNFARSQELYQRKLLSQKDYDQLRYDLEAQQAVYQQKVLALSWTRITAPIGGVISRRMVKRGNLIQTNQALFHIVDMRPLLAVLHVPERELGRLQPGQTAHLAVDALGRHDFTGDVLRIAPVVDAASGTFRVTCEFDHDGGVLRPGMFARIAIIYDQRRNALVIPRSAVVEEDGRSTVYVVVHQVARLQAPRGSGGREQARAAALPSAAVEIVRRVVIRTGYGDGDRIEVLTGLKRGDRVVTLGQNNLRDGTAVTVVERAP
jgi:membrane fusion protein (multidrug efflux system)